MGLFDSDEEEETRTPDLQASAGLSYGGSGNQLMEMIQNLGPSPAQLTGQALAGGVAFARGQANPVTPIINQQMVQQNQIMGMIQKMGAQQDLNKYRQDTLQARGSELQLQRDQLVETKKSREQKADEGRLKILKDSLDDTKTTPAFRAILQPQYAAQFSKVTGAPIESLPTTLLQPEITQAQKLGVWRDIKDGLPPEIVLRNNPWLPPEDLPKYAANQNNDSVMKQLGMPSAGEQTIQDLTIKGLQADLLEKQHPELKMNPHVGAAMLMKARTLHPGKNYSDLTDSEQTTIYKMAVLEQRQQVLDEYRQKAQIDAQKQIQVEGVKLSMRAAADLLKEKTETIASSKKFFVDKAGNPAPSDLTIQEATQKGFFQISHQEYDALNTGQQAMLILDNMKSTIDEMKSEGLFVTKSGLAGVYESGKIAAASKFGNVETSRRLLGNFESQKAQMVILLRLLGEKGVRALGAMTPAMDALNPHSGAPAAESVLGNIESEIRILGLNTKTPKAFTDKPTIFPRYQSKPPIGPLTPSNEWRIEEIR